MGEFRISEFFQNKVCTAPSSSCSLNFNGWWHDADTDDLSVIVIDLHMLTQFYTALRLYLYIMYTYILTY